ncbi:LCP family protein (plasmid) [Streptomyces sp. HUAS 31]|uniref:LCP family protein n=1 Tax=Streptomyces TaxID=1883 RepID=UPI0023065CED|nr:LCP family protein [Streptomyces sp. HUAS 31]WCE02502.1 LCP family protein [Streptomyces sp. HUAS 31]
MTERSRRGRDGRRPRGLLRRAGSRAAYLVAVVGGAVVLTAAVTAGYAYISVDSTRKSVDLDRELGTRRPRNVEDGSLDILLLGSDSRAGDNAEYGRDEGSSRSDTAMLVHIHEGRTRATVVSIPRDTLVFRPPCPGRDGRTVAAQDRAMFNSAYEVGGPACAVRTVEHLSGIRLDHYIEVEFSGFKDIVDALGGVELTTTERIVDTDSRIDLPAGTHTLNGEQALALVRTRKGVGDGSDLGRIELQQAVFTALLHQIKRAGTFTDPKKLYDLARISARSITTDEPLASTRALIEFASALKALAADRVHLVTLPVAMDAVDPNRVVPLPEESRLLWQALRQDRPVPGGIGRGAAGGRAKDVVKPKPPS